MEYELGITFFEPKNDPWIELKIIWTKPPSFGVQNVNAPLKKRNMSPEKRDEFITLPIFLWIWTWTKPPSFRFQPLSFFCGFLCDFTVVDFFVVGCFHLGGPPQAKVAKHVADRSGIPRVVTATVTSPSTTWLAPKISETIRTAWRMWMIQWMVQWFLDLPPFLSHYLGHLY